MDKVKKKLSPPAGIDDWWNEDVVTTTAPKLRNKNEDVRRSFTAQEEKEILNHFLENGFC